MSDRSPTLTGEGREPARSGLVAGFTACQLGLVAVTFMPGVGEPALGAIRLLSLFFFGAALGAFAHGRIHREVG